VVVGAIVLFLLFARVVGFNPGIETPGLWLRGELVTEPVTDWTPYEKLQPTAIQSRLWFAPFIAHSVITARWHYKGRLYISSGYAAGVQMPDARLWNRNVLADPHVRIRLGNKLFDTKFVYVTDPIEHEEVMHAAVAVVGALFWAPGLHFPMWRVEPLP